MHRDSSPGYMSSDDELVAFGCKWLPKFRDIRVSYCELFDSLDFSSDCFALGFEMNCGNSFGSAPLRSISSMRFV